MNSYWETSWWLASKLVDLVWSNKAPILNLSFLGSMFTTILGVGGNRYKIHILREYSESLKTNIDVDKLFPYLFLQIIFLLMLSQVAFSVKCLVGHFSLRGTQKH